MKKKISYWARSKRPIVQTNKRKARMNLKQIAIIGTDCITLSIALRIKTWKEHPEIIGYHADKIAADLAHAQGAFDRVERKPGKACQDADLIIVSVPLTEMRETFTVIAPHLKPGALVTDTAHLKAPVMGWAEELLPENVLFVGGHLILNPAIVGLTPKTGLDEASDDLLTEALYCFTTPPGVPDTVIDALAEFAHILNAQPLFIDVTEHDGLQSGVEGLTDILAIALLRSTVDTPGWREMRKFADHHFAAATQVIEDAHERHAAIFLNREHVLHRLNVLLAELVHLRDVLTKDDAKLLEETFMGAAEGRKLWLREREQGMWTKEQSSSTSQLPSMGGQIRQLFLGGSPRRPREEKK
jgi:prephenate dehydrogenase